jgi:hypothetical protein
LSRRSDIIGNNSYPVGKLKSPNGTQNRFHKKLKASKFSISSVYALYANLAGIFLNAGSNNANTNSNKHKQYTRNF